MKPEKGPELWRAAGSYLLDVLIKCGTVKFLLRALHGIMGNTDKRFLETTVMHCLDRSVGFLNYAHNVEWGR